MKKVQTMPKIIIRGRELKKTIEKWLDDELYAKDGMEELFSALDASADDTITLYDFDLKNRFSVHSAKDGNFEMVLSFNDEESYQEFSIVKPYSEYNYFFAYDEEVGVSIALSSYLFEDKDSGNAFYHRPSRFMTDYTLVDGTGENRLTIKMLGPQKVKRYLAPDMYEYTDTKFENKGLFELKLLNMTFPVDVEKIYQLLADHSYGGIYNNYRVYIKIEKIENFDEPIVTDKMLVAKGELVEYAATKDGKYIRCDEGGNWLYEDDKITASHNNGKYGYSLTSMPEASIIDRLSPMEELKLLEANVVFMKDEINSRIKR